MQRVTLSFAAPTLFQRLLSSYHFKLALHSSEHHTSEVHWSQYTGSLLSSLPYRWQHPSHTQLRTAHFVKSSRRNAVPEDSPVPFNLNFLRPNKATPGTKSSTVNEDNVLVVHHLKGIEVLSLPSGQPMCRYKLTKETQTIGDVNNDGVLDHVTLHFTPHTHRFDVKVRPCSAVVMSNSRTLFTGSICGAGSLGTFFSSPEDEHMAEPLPVAPLLVRSPPHRAGMLRHLLGHNVHKLGQTYDSVFLTSGGKVTSFGPHGEPNWHVSANQCYS